ncbi:GTP-binding protein [Zhihengliuella sp.]|uniref:GTP-binding protein n=1 Tax=Zhihengliuella sp. TaxID=1954483 RepID=UPI002812296B|nr:GTP-binding protein [Zhihengliuella sp.]
MGQVKTVLVVGACAPERHEHASAIARARGATIVRPEGPGGSVLGGPVLDGSVLRGSAASASTPGEAGPSRRLPRWLDDLAATLHVAAGRDDVRGIVVDLPAEVPVLDAIGLFDGDGSPGPVADVVCVVDAAHLLEDLFDGEYLPGFVARALLAVRQIEFATVVAVTNWSGLTGPDVSLVVSLISHLNPTAHLELDVQRWLDDDRRGAPNTPTGLRPGWIRRLNSDHPSSFAPRIRDERVSTLRYDSVRPFHPERLRVALDELERGGSDRGSPELGGSERGGAGRVVRSAGFARLATRSGITAQWEHVGRMFDLLPLEEDGAAEEPLCVGQDLILTGIGLDEERLRRLLDAAVLTDDELLAGPREWAGFHDPFPAWVHVRDRA